MAAELFEATGHPALVRLSDSLQWPLRSLRNSRDGNVLHNELVRASRAGQNATGQIKKNRKPLLVNDLRSGGGGQAIRRRKPSFLRAFSQFAFSYWLPYWPLLSFWPQIIFWISEDE